MPDPDLRYTDRLGAFHAKGLPVFDLNEADEANGFTYVECMFPHFFLPPFFSAMSSHRLRPLAPESGYCEIWSLAPMASDDSRPHVTQPTRQGVADRVNAGFDSPIEDIGLGPILG